MRAPHLRTPALNNEEENDESAVLVKRASAGSDTEWSSALILEEGSGNFTFSCDGGQIIATDSNGVQTRFNIGGGEGIIITLGTFTRFTLKARANLGESLVSTQILAGAADPATDPAVDQVWQIYKDGIVIGGTFTITFDVGIAAETTTPLDYDASAADIQAALEAFTGIGAGNVTCAGGDLPGADIYPITFIGALAGEPHRQFSTDSTGLTGGGSYVASEQKIGKPTGTEALVGSLYLRSSGGTGETWLKSGTGDTDWLRLLTTDDL